MLSVEARKHIVYTLGAATLLFGSAYGFEKATPVSASEVAPIRVTVNPSIRAELIALNPTPTPKIDIGEPPVYSPTAIETPVRVCVQVIVFARDPQTGLINEYSDPCHVPAGFEILPQKTITLTPDTGISGAGSINGRLNISAPIPTETRQTFQAQPLNIFRGMSAPYFDTRAATPTPSSLPR